VSTRLADGPGSREPGLDQLIKALTADGHPSELAGKGAALAAFRAASAQPRRKAGFRPLPGAPARVSAVAAALIAAFAGLTAAAYAKALPAPVQHIAYSVFSPLGVPDNQTAPAGHSIRKPGRPARHVHVVPRHVSPTPSPSPSPTCPCPSATAHRALTGAVLAVTVTRVQLPANGWDQFTGRLTVHGRPEPGIRIRLLERPAGSARWILAGSGVTGGHGRMRVGIPHLTQNATFRFAGPHRVRSDSVSVTVIPRVLLWRAAARPGTNRLVASARFGDAGDIVELQKRSGGAWQNVTSEVLNMAHRASFTLSASQSGGHYYRIRLAATSAHGAAMSAAVFVPRAKSGIGAKAIVPPPIRLPHPGAPHHGGGHRSPGPVTSPGPVLPGPVTPPGPVVPGPVVVPTTPVPTPVLPGPTPSASPTAEPGPSST
jgi:hypothetical protein